MYITADLRKLILDPVLKMSLRAEVDEFLLHTSDGPVSCGATIVFEAGERRFRLELRDKEGRNFKSFFRNAKTYTQADTLRATGTVGGTLRIELQKIWPPTRSTVRPVGAVRYSSASLSFGVIAFPPEELDRKSNTELRAMFRHLSGKEPDDSADRPDERFQHEHFAIFVNTGLKFKNGVTQRKTSHAFWGEMIESNTDSWDGKALGGEFSVRQTGAHLELAFRHEGGSKEDAQTIFKAFLNAFAYTHAILPWPTYTESRCGGSLCERWLCGVTQEQGRFFPMREDPGVSSDAPAILLDAIAGLFIEVGAEKANWLGLALWGLRAADSPIASTPVQIIMVCAVVEGLRSRFYESASPPSSFVALKQESLSWLDEIETESQCRERKDLIERLRHRIKSWEFNSRRVEWDGAFQPMFNGKDQWLKELFNVFNDNRHDPAHGNFLPIAEGDSLELLDAIGRLAGFANIVIAARAGFSGKLLSSPFGDETIDVGNECDAMKS